ncbi:LAETG motif-containing sortase-dependent surface protein [Streptomyces sp. NPDC003090]|uniref:LAETG motif-containing sortase-dependent surface protein n=1 Tax=unclassified Streptomyces TaxID=2593676 RepID=UPI00381A968E
MQKHLSSRIARRSFVSARSAVTAAAVLLTVVTPVAVAAAPAFAQPAAASSATTAGMGVKVDLMGGFALGQRAHFSAEITNGTGADLQGVRKGLVTVAYGKHVNAALEPMTADPSKIIVEHLKDGVWQRLPLTTGANGAVQAAFPLPEGLAKGATVRERFVVTIQRSIPAEANMGEVGVSGHADGSGMDTVGFGLGNRQTAEHPEVTLSGLSGRPELVTGGKPVTFTGTVTNNTGKDIPSAQDFFFIAASDKGGDLDPQYVTLERRDASGAWKPVRIGEQDRALTGNLDGAPLKNGQSRTYELRLALTKFTPASVTGGEFTLVSGDGAANFDFSVKYVAPDVTDPEINRKLAVTSSLKGTTRLKAGGAAKEFTATITNKGNITQEVEAIVELGDGGAKRKVSAGEFRVEQYVTAAADGWKSVKLTDSTWSNGKLRALASPTLVSLAPGESVTYKLRVAATTAVKGKAFDVSVTSAAERSVTGVVLPFTVDGAPGTAGTTGTTGSTGGATASPSASAAPAGGAGATGTGSGSGTGAANTPAAAGEMAKTGSDTTTPVLLGATGVLVAGGAAALLIARRRAL